MAIRQYAEVLLSKRYHICKGRNAYVFPHRDAALG